MTAGFYEAIARRRLFWESRVAMVAPFATMYLLALTFYPFGNPTYGGWMTASLGSSVAVLAGLAFAPWERLPQEAADALLLLAIASVAFLREAHGGALSGFSPLMLVPVVWAAVFGRRRDLGIVVVGTAVALVTPALLDPAGYPAGEFRRAVLFVFSALLCGLVIQVLIRALIRAEEDLALVRAQEIHDDLVQSLAAASIALDLGDTRTAYAAIRNGLTSAQAMVAATLTTGSGRLEPGNLRRRLPSQSHQPTVDPGSDTERPARAESQ